MSTVRSDQQYSPGIFREDSTSIPETITLDQTQRSPRASSLMSEKRSFNSGTELNAIGTTGARGDYVVEVSVR